MAKFQVLKGSTSVLIRIFVQDSSKTNGAGLTGLTNGSTGLTCYVARDDDGNAAATQLSLSAGTRGTWSSGGIKEKDATNQPGVYELGLSNASLATGSRSCTYYLQGAANMAPVTFEIELTSVDNQSTAFGLSIAKTTNITGFNDVAATAIVSSGAITTSGGAVSTVTTATNLTNAPTAGDFTATMKTSLNASTPASVSGSVGSVTASVTVNGTSALTESYAAQGAGLTLSQALYGITQQMGQMSISGTIMTIKKRDAATTAKTYALNDATTPTAISETT